MTVSGLSPSTLYYFAVKTSDEVPNTSGLSNVVSRTTSAIVLIEFDAAASLPTQLVPSANLNITTAQANEVIFLSVMVSNGAGIPPTATLDGVAMTPIQTVAVGISGYLRLLWGVAASAGPHTIAITASFAGGNGWSATAIALQNVNTTSPVDASFGNTSVQSGSLVTTVVGDWIVSVGGYSSATFGSNIDFDPGPNPTERIDSLVPAEVAMATQAATTPGIHVSSWTASTGIFGAAGTILAAIKPQ